MKWPHFFGPPAICVVLLTRIHAPGCVSVCSFNWTDLQCGEEGLLRLKLSPMPVTADFEPILNLSVMRIKVKLNTTFCRYVAIVLWRSCVTSFVLNFDKNFCGWGSVPDLTRHIFHNSLHFSSLAGMKRTAKWCGRLCTLRQCNHIESNWPVTWKPQRL